MIRRRELLGGVAAGLAGTALGCRRLPPDAEGRSHAALWFSYGGRNREVLERLVGQFNSSQSEHWIQPVFQGDYFEALAKLRAALAARAAPATSHVVGEVVPYLAEAGVLEPMDGYDGASSLDVLPALAQRGSWIGGDARPLVALPFNRSTPIVYLNGDALRETGVAPPRTWTEMREAARALTRRHGGTTVRWGFECPIEWWFWVALVGQAGGDVIEPDGTVSLGGDAGVRALEHWKAMVGVDRTMKPPPGRDYNAWEATNQDFLAGRAAMIWTSTAFLKYLEDNAKFPVVAAPLPADVRAAVPTGGTHFVMLRSAPEREKRTGWAFLRFMMDPGSVIEWSTSTGYMPVTRTAIERMESSGYYAAHPNDRVAVDQLAVARPWPWSRHLFRIQREIVQPRLEQAVLADRDARTVLAEAREEAQRGLLR